MKMKLFIQNGNKNYKIMRNNFSKTSIKPLSRDPQNISERD